MPIIRIFNHKQPFTLDSGEVVHNLRLAYTAFGNLNAKKDNVVWVFHALTANADPTDWWQGLVGRGKLIDPDRHYVVCVNMPGSCYGSFGPLDKNPLTGEPYFYKFPFFTPRDMVRAYQPLRKYLGIKKILLGIGGSMGGQQLLEWAVEEPDLFSNIVPIATSAVHSPWGKAFNTSQRMAIENDPTWGDFNLKAGLEGMKVARSIALLSYRHFNSYNSKQSDDDAEHLSGFRSETYQKYQGDKLAKRFNAFSYYALTRSMDANNLGRSRGGVVLALKQITAKTLVIGIKTDLLFPLDEQRFIAANVHGAEFTAIYSEYGHDGFLLEYEEIASEVRNFLPKLTAHKAVLV